MLFFYIALSALFALSILFDRQSANSANSAMSFFMPLLPFLPCYFLLHPPNVADKPLVILVYS
jgi:hypothetical protein